MLLVATAILLSVQLSFKQGLNTYIAKLEKNKWQGFTELLANRYQRQANWDFIRDNPEQWFALVAEFERNAKTFEVPALIDTPTPSHHHPHLGAPMPPPPIPIHPKNIDRLVVLDAELVPVIGPPDPENVVSQQSTLVIPIKVSEHQVGSLLISPPLITDELATAFIESQALNNSVILFLAIGLSIPIALSITRHLLSPLRRVAAGVKALADGQLDSEIIAKGHDELADLARDVNFLGKTLRSSEASRKQWIADISHELRTPLAILLGEIEALLDGVRSVTPDRLHSLHNEVIGLARLVDDLYQLSLSDLGALEYRFEQFNIIELLTASVMTFSPRFDSKQLTLQLTLSENVHDIFINADALRLEQAIANLLENSFRYTYSGGICMISVAKQVDTLLIVIEDSPPGVANVELKQLFQRYRRIHQYRSNGGAGLGLMLCRNIIEAHNGRIHAKRSQLGGVAILIELPLSID